MRLPFNAVEHGFAFSNSFTNHVVTIPALKIDITTSGRCGGMAFAALDYWHHGLAVPDAAGLPADGSLLGDYIYARLLDSMRSNGWRFVRSMATPDAPGLLGSGVARTTREQEYPKLRRALDGGSPCVLGLSQARDIKGLGNDHQVVAYGYEDGAGSSRVFIYDNNDPRRERFLEFTTAYDPDDCQVRGSNQEIWRGFFVEDYDTQVPGFLAGGRLLSERSHPATYVIHRGGRFLIPTAAEFDANGFDPHEVLEIQDGSLAHVATRPGNGTLLKERTADPVFLVRGGRAFDVSDPAAFEALRLERAAVRSIPDGSLGGLPTAPVRDGTLLSELSDPRVYVARGGQLHLVPDEARFQAEGFVTADIGLVPDGSLGGVPMGQPLPSSPDPKPVSRLG
jgi:hypothetical protein